MSVLERGRERVSINNILVCVREREGEGKYQ